MSESTMNVADLRAQAVGLQGLREQAVGLRLHGLLAHWSEVMGEPETAHRVAQWLGWEATERGRRSLERRVREAHIGRFKPDRKSTRLNSSHIQKSRMPSSA